MAQSVNATNLQKLEYDVTTAEGPSHITIVSGLLQVSLAAAGGSQQGSFETLLDPTLVPGKFRKATAVASIVSWVVDGGTIFGFSIDQVEATWDDEFRQDSIASRCHGSGGDGDRSYPADQRHRFSGDHAIVAVIR